MSNEHKISKMQETEARAQIHRAEQVAIAREAQDKKHAETVGRDTISYAHLTTPSINTALQEIERNGGEMLYEMWYQELPPVVKVTQTPWELLGLQERDAWDKVAARLVA